MSAQVPDPDAVAFLLFQDELVFRDFEVLQQLSRRAALWSAP
jgi:hypothetical protein